MPQAGLTEEFINIFVSYLSKGRIAAFARTLFRFHFFQELIEYVAKQLRALFNPQPYQSER